MTTAALFDSARAALATRGFDADVQTRIALFLGAVKSINLGLLATAELLPANHIAYPFMHGQYFREAEFATLLSRVTTWSANPKLYLEASALVQPLWNEYWRIQGVLGTILDPVATYRGLAYGHALLARVRLAPILPEDIDATNAFVAAIRRIEQENGRMLQAQIRLLKDMPVEIDRAARERIVEEEQVVVDQGFERFLAWLAQK